MMAKYSDKFKYSIVKKMMPPENQSVSQIARETGLSEATLHKWKKQARAKGLPMPGGEQETLLTEFDESLWAATLKAVVIKSNHEVIFQFKHGTELSWSI
jgi:transposase-like protein